MGRHRRDSFEVVHVEITNGRSSRDALLFFRTVLERCHGQPLLPLDRGPWYDWAAEFLGCESRRETFGELSLVEAWFSVLKYRTLLFWQRSLQRSSVESIDCWTRTFALLH